MTVRRPPRRLVLAAISIIAGVMISGCSVEEGTGNVIYVPVPPVDAGGGAAAPGGNRTPPTEVVTPSPTQTFTVKPEWEKSCIALSEFASTYQSTLVFSVSLLKNAAKVTPEEEARKDLRSLAKSLEESEESFSLALLGEDGERINQVVLRECGTPLLLDYEINSNGSTMNTR